MSKTGPRAGAAPYWEKNKPKPGPSGSKAGRVPGGASPSSLPSGVAAKPASAPPAPTFVSPLNADNTLGDKFNVSAGPAVGFNAVSAGPAVNFQSLDPNALGSDKRALDAMRERALGGESPWLKLQLEKQGVNQLQNTDDAVRTSMSSAAAARTAAGMRGGLSAGASERMAKSNASMVNAARQNTARAGQLDRLNLGIADDQTNMALLNQTAGLDLAHGAQGQDMAKFNSTGNLDASKFNSGMAFDANKFNSTGAFNADTFNSGQQFQANQFNQGNELGALGALNQFNMGKYSEDMKGYAAGKQANAMAGGGKSGLGK